VTFCICHEIIDFPGFIMDEFEGKFLKEMGNGKFAIANWLIFTPKMVE
jgi:hypothetical protein